MARAVNDAGPSVLYALIGALAVQPNASFGHVVEIVERGVAVSQRFRQLYGRSHQL